LQKAIGKLYQSALHQRLDAVIDEHLAVIQVEIKWPLPVWNWGRILGIFIILFTARLSNIGL
jgi:hypothetical protein